MPPRVRSCAAAKRWRCARCATARTARRRRRAAARRRSGPLPRLPRRRGGRWRACAGPHARTGGRAVRFVRGARGVRGARVGRWRGGGCCRCEACGAEGARAGGGGRRALPAAKGPRGGRARARRQGGANAPAAAPAAAAPEEAPAADASPQRRHLRKVISSFFTSRCVRACCHSSRTRGVSAATPISLASRLVVVIALAAPPPPPNALRSPAMPSPATSLTRTRAAASSASPPPRPGRGGSSGTPAPPPPLRAAGPITWENESGGCSGEGPLSPPAPRQRAGRLRPHGERAAPAAAAAPPARGRRGGLLPARRRGRLRGAARLPFKLQHLDKVRGLLANQHTDGGPRLARLRKQQARLQDAHRNVQGVRAVRQRHKANPHHERQLRKQGEHQKSGEPRDLPGVVRRGGLG